MWSDRGENAATDIIEFTIDINYSYIYKVVPPSYVC